MIESPEDTTLPPSTSSEKTENETLEIIAMTVTKSESVNENQDVKTSEIRLLVRLYHRLSKMPLKRSLILTVLFLMLTWYEPSMTLPLE